jgi:ubiquinone/menaquinone biosynthesis C-methylase UbiE
VTKAFLHDANVLRARIPMPPQATQLTGAQKYHGEVAKGYDAKREDTDKWRNEQAIVERWIRELAPKSVLDIPVGTGRFLPLYAELGCHVIGRDLSSDMLQEAAKKAGENCWLGIGDARAIDQPDGSVDVAVCCRLMRWLETNETQLQVISELCRVAKKAVIFNVRTSSGPLPLDPVKIAGLLAEAGWHIADQATIMDDFTFFLLEKA